MKNILIAFALAIVLYIIILMLAYGITYTSKTYTCEQIESAEICEMYNK